LNYVKITINSSTSINLLRNKGFRGEVLMELMLSPYRVLDLTDEKGFLCGKILADLGADVIKIERPGGDPSRNISPFYHGIADMDKSLYWFAYNANKRGITLNIETTDGKEIFKRLAKRADFIIESFSPGYLDSLGLGYSALSQVNPRLIMTSITPFGQAGPYRDYKATDLVAMALGGALYIIGDPDRPPVRFPGEQAYLQAAVHAAVGTMMAHNYCRITGQGQKVDVSIQESVARLLGEGPCFWDFMKKNVQRSGNRIPRANFYQHDIWPCKDGYISWRFHGGVWGASEWETLVEWMDNESMAGTLKGENWKEMDVAKLSQETVDAWEEVVGSFFLKHTLAELEKGYKELHFTPVLAPGDMLKNPQLLARGYWTPVEHPELGTVITYPGHFFLSNETGCQIRRRAPLIGEHNEEIYSAELELSKQEITILKESGII
jgi:benzylsuccinate CoA-transferase BbsE subunit